MSRLFVSLMIGNILQKFEKNLSSGFFFFKGMTFIVPFLYLGVNSKHFYLANRSAITVKALIGPLSNNPPFPLNKMAVSVKTEGIMC